MWYTHIYLRTYLVGAAIPVGAIYLRRLSFFGKMVWVIVLFNVAGDVFATYLDKGLDIQTHTFLNIFTIVENLVVIFLYSTTYSDTLSKTKVYLFSLGLILFAVLNFTCIQGQKDFNTYTYGVGGLFIACLAYLKLRELMLKDNFSATNFLVWYSVANVVFYLISAPAISVVLIANKISHGLSKNLLQIKNVVYVLWAFIISLGFIWQKKT